MSVAPDRADAPAPSGHASLTSEARTLQLSLLDEVSRTFALTIPRLPVALADVVGNAYLLCRIVDTIEDEINVSTQERAELYDRFNACLTTESPHGDAAARDFTAELAERMPPRAPAGELRLVRHIPEVLEWTAGFSLAQREAMQECVAVMTRGMHEFEALGATGQGLADTSTLSRYCYHVAGCVGELLTRLFCLHDERIDAQRDALLPLSRAFGRGLQLTNILKDMWVDQRRGVCWLPQDVFHYALTDTGVENTSLPATDVNALMRDAAASDASAVEQLEAGTRELVAQCRHDLDLAMQYVRLLPESQRQLRVFCLWSIGLSVLTLRKIQRQSVSERLGGTKVSRNSVKATLVLSGLSAGLTPVMQALYAAACFGLPAPREHA